MSFRLRSASPDETRALGRALAGAGLGGVLVALEGELGAGKTLLTRGIFEGLGLPPALWSGSPTFVLASDYRAAGAASPGDDAPGGGVPDGAAGGGASPGRAPGLVHADLYRLGSADEIPDLGLGEAVEAGDAVVVEWADRFPEALPADRLRVRIEAPRPDEREIELVATGPRSRACLEGALAALAGAGPAPAP